MKTSVIDVRDMLSVLSVLGVEKRIGEVPGVESVTVNFAARNATVRYDETRLEVADIKSHVRQRGHEAAAEPQPPHAGEHGSASAGAGAASPHALSDAPATPVDVAPKLPPVAPEAAASAPAPLPTPTQTQTTPAAENKAAAQPGAIGKLTTWEPRCGWGRRATRSRRSVRYRRTSSSCKQKNG